MAYINMAAVTSSGTTIKNAALAIQLYREQCSHVLLDGALRMYQKQFVYTDCTVFFPKRGPPWFHCYN